MIQEIRNEQAHQYIIGYTSYQDTSDLYRWIRVATPNHKLQDPDPPGVLTSPRPQTGYFAGRPLFFAEKLLR